MNVKYVVSLVSGVLECLLFSGILFGWASLNFVLQKEGYFYTCSDKATSNTAISNQTATTETSPVNASGNFLGSTPATVTDQCDTAQSEKLNLVFTISSTLLSLSTLLNGYIYDRFGTWVARAIAVLLFTLGSVLMAISSPATSWLLFPSMSCFAIGGILLMVTNLQIGNLFGRFRSSIITLMSGALDSSSFVFLSFKMMYEGGIDLNDIFIVVTACSVIMWLRTFTLLPRMHIPFPINRGYDYGITDCKHPKKEPESKEMALVNNPDDTVNAEEKDALTHDGNDDTIVKNVPSASTYIKTSLFWGNVIHFSLLQLRNYFFMSSLYSWLLGLAGDEVSSYLDVFGICQLFGVCFAPLNGLLIDSVSRILKKNAKDPELVPLRAVVFSAIATSLLGTLFSVIIVIPSLPLQYFSFILQVIFRSFLYGGNMSFIASAFPGQHFGKLYGLTMFIGGIVGLLQFPLFTLVLRQMNGDFLIVNTIFVIISFLTLLHPLNVYWWCKKRGASNSK